MWYFAKNVRTGNIEIFQAEDKPQPKDYPQYLCVYGGYKTKSYAIRKAHWMFDVWRIK